MARNKGTFQFAANFEVKSAEWLDPRQSVETKAELIAKETWPYDGDTIYMKKGMRVTVEEENAVYMLIDYAKILATDYSGWLRIDAGNAEQVEVVDNLSSDSAVAALSAKQGKVLNDRITSVADQLTNVYVYRGSVATFEDLPSDVALLVAGDVYNVEAAYGGNAAGTNYAWTGSEWDALAGIVDLSNYFNKEEVNAAIKVETDRAVAEEGRLAGLIGSNTTLAQEAKSLATDNKSALDSLSVSVGNINLVLNGNDDDTDDIPNQLGLVGRLEAVETLIGEPTEADQASTMLSRLNALEDLVTGGESGEGEGDQTLLQKVNANTLAISALQSVVGDANSGLVKAVNTLNGDVSTVGSVDYKIDQAFQWVDVE